MSFSFYVFFFLHVLFVYLLWFTVCLHDTFMTICFLLWLKKSKADPAPLWTRCCLPLFSIYAQFSICPSDTHHQQLLSPLSLYTGHSQPCISLHLTFSWQANSTYWLKIRPPVLTGGALYHLNTQHDLAGSSYNVRWHQSRNPVAALHSPWFYYHIHSTVHKNTNNTFKKRPLLLRYKNSLILSNLTADVTLSAMKPY